MCDSRGAGTGFAVPAPFLPFLRCVNHTVVGYWDPVLVVDRADVEPVLLDALLPPVDLLLELVPPVVPVEFPLLVPVPVLSVLASVPLVFCVVFVFFELVVRFFELLLEELVPLSPGVKLCFVLDVDLSVLEKVHSLLAL